MIRLLLSVSILGAGESPRLRIDPLLLAQVAEVYGLIADAGTDGWQNPIWNGWNARDTPILLYLPDVQDALVNHPRPPIGFVPAQHPGLPSGWTLHLRDGTTHFEVDGQNTSTDIEGIETLVVADPLSNLRPGLSQLVRAPGDVHDKEAALTADFLATDPYQQLAFVVHEAFHVHQFRRAGQKMAQESWLGEYPWLAARNLAGFVLEGRLLERALRAEDPFDVAQGALDFLAVRLDRRASLSPQAVAYEDGTEFSEGLAKYTEWKLAETLEGRTPQGPLHWARGFHGYDDLQVWREDLLGQMRAMMDGTVAVNGNLYGAGCLRMRLYSSGMGQAVLLDRLGIEDWQDRILQPETSLTGLLTEVLMATPAELREALDEVHRRENYAQLLVQKQAFEAEGRADALRRSEELLSTRPLLTLDYASLDEAQVAWTYTPFGMARLEDGSTLYDSTPLSVEIGHHASLEQEVALPALYVPREQRIHVPLRGPLPDDLPVGEQENLELALPGLEVRSLRAVLEREDGQVTIRLLP